MTARSTVMKPALLLVGLGLSILRAQGTVQQSLSQLGTGDGRVLAFNWTGDSSNGSVPVTRGRLQGCCREYYVTQVVVRPGSPSPSEGYSVMLTDAASNDFLGGSAARLSATTTQSFAPTAAAPALRGTINLIITGQRVQGARGSVYVYLRKSGPPKSNQFRTSGNPPNWPPSENLPFVEPRKYDFAPQTPGSNLFPGASTILLAPVPTGVNGSDANHYLYVSGGTGTAESCLVKGGTAVAGSSSGTLTIRCANSHSGDWSVRSATGGMQEAVVYMGNRGGTLLIPAGTLETFARTSIYQHICVMGAGPDATFVNNNSTTSGVFLFQLVNTATATGGACLANLTISAGGATNTSIHGSNSAAVLANGIGNSKTGMWIHDIIVKNHDIGVDLEGVLYVYLTNFTLLYQHSYGIKLNGSAFINNGVISNSGATGLPAAAGTAGFLWVDGGGLYMHDVDITAMPNGVMVQPIAGGSVSAGLFDSVLGDTSNAHGWLFDATHGPIFQMQLTGCWGGFNGCYSPAILAENLTDADTTITVHPSTSQPYPSGPTHLTLNQEQIVCDRYSPPTFSGCSRGQFGTAAAAHGMNSNVFVCGFPGDGLHVQGPSGNIDGITINGGMWSGNGGNAMQFRSGKNLQVSNALISQNSNYQTLAASEIAIGPDVSNWSIRGSTIGNYATIETPRAGYGVSVSPGVSDNYVISGNQFVNLGLGPIRDSGTGIHKIIGDNLGIDEQVILVASATSFTFPVNPTFQITGTTAITSVAGLWAGRRGVFITNQAVPFVAGATIGNSCTTAPSKLYSYFFDGAKVYIGGSGC